MLFGKLFGEKKPELQEKLKTVLHALRKSSLPLVQLAMIERIVENTYTPVQHIMAPRVDVRAFEISMLKQDLKTEAMSCAYSRFPIYDGNIDNVKGILHINDLFQYVFSEKKEPRRLRKTATKKPKSKSSRLSRGDSGKNGNGENFALRSYLSEPIFIPRSRGIFDVLGDMQQKAQQMAIVVDEYAGFSGLVTMEDILEEIIGDVRDESDEEQDEIMKLSPNRFSVDARTPLDDLQKVLGVNFSAEEANSANTIGGFVIDVLGFVPDQGKGFSWKNLHFKIKTKEGNSLKRLLIKISKVSRSQKKE